ncbi:MAG: DUF4406 domain-containing protein [Treponema sp.]|nr:DUF4406 domain-containing protein [Treponema sp.]
MTIYVSGAITGMPQDNKHAFNNACSQIKRIAKKHGLQTTVKTINPIKIGKQVRTYFEKYHQRDPEWADYMRSCIKKLCGADCAYFLPDWAGSDGASLERHIVKRLGMPCLDTMDDLERILTKSAGS